MLNFQGFPAIKKYDYVKMAVTLEISRVNDCVKKITMPTSVEISR